MTLFAWIFALIAALSSATSPAPVVPARSVAPAIAHVHQPAAAASSTPAPLCSDGTSKVPVGGGHLGCPGPNAAPGPVGVPPGFTAVDPAPANPADPCFRQDPECYATATPRR